MSIEPGMKKVLVIEDDPVTGIIYQRGMTKQGFIVEVARDGAKGLERVAAFQPDVIILDLVMPIVGGIEFLKGLRGQESFRELPVIALTNAYVPAFVDQAKAAGASHVMDKSKTTPAIVAELLCAAFKLEIEKPSPAVG